MSYRRERLRCRSTFPKIEENENISPNTDVIEAVDSQSQINNNYNTQIQPVEAIEAQDEEEKDEVLAKMPEEPKAVTELDNRVALDKLDDDNLSTSSSEVEEDSIYSSVFKTNNATTSLLAVGEKTENEGDNKSLSMDGTWATALSPTDDDDDSPTSAISSENPSANEQLANAMTTESGTDTGTILSFKSYKRKEHFNVL